jgi:hypothetical protein
MIILWIDSFTTIDALFEYLPALVLYLADRPWYDATFVGLWLNASKPASNPLPMILGIFFFLLQKCRKKKLRLFFFVVRWVDCAIFFDIETIKKLGATSEDKLKSADDIMKASALGKAVVAAALQELSNKGLAKRVARSKSAGYYILK